MIEQFNADRSGWARFSDDMVMRFRLARSLTGEPIETIGPAHRVTFVMLNPSTADAFVEDPTIRRCMGFARALGAAGLDVVNLFALRSTDPRELNKLISGFRGDDYDSTTEIIGACQGRHRVIVAWGARGNLDARASMVALRMTSNGIAKYHLGVTKDGSPRHPLYLKIGAKIERWSASDACFRCALTRAEHMLGRGRDCEAWAEHPICGSEGSA